MRLVVTGGGTGGHVYPALEVAREAQVRGVELLYFGSLRGQECVAAEKAGIAFRGFRAEPIYSIRKPAGWKALAIGLRSVGKAKIALREAGADCVFSTGGYGAFPVLFAAKSLRVPTFIHMIDSVPGRVNRLFVKRAVGVSCVFHQTRRLVPAAVRTGQPIRKQLRDAAESLDRREPLVLVTGGSQGSAFLNGAAPRAARLLKQPAQWLHATGPAHLEAMRALGLPKGYEVESYLDTEAMASAYGRATIAVGRSGGTVAEYALFRLPSILVPLPSSSENHQLHNAEEFVAMEAATLLPQDRTTPEALAEAADEWLVGVERRESAAKALAAWDCPNATSDIVDLILTQ